MKRHFFLTLSVLVGLGLCQTNPAGAQVQGNGVSRGPTIGLRSPGTSVITGFRMHSTGMEFNASRYNRTQSNPLAFNQRTARSQVNRGASSVLSRDNKLRPTAASNRLGSALIRPGDAFQNLDNLLTSKPTMHTSRALATSRITSVGNQRGPIAPIRPTNTAGRYQPRYFLPSLSLSKRGTLAVRSRLGKRKPLSRRMTMAELAKEKKSRESIRSIHFRRRGYLQNYLSNPSFSRTSFLSNPRKSSSFLRR